MNTKSFSLGALLSVTTGRLLTSFDELQVILDWMTSDNTYTHAIPRASAECKPWLLKWFPELDFTFPGELFASCHDRKQAVSAWLQSLDLPAQFEVGKIHVGDHKRCDPTRELIELSEAKSKVIEFTL